MSYKLISKKFRKILNEINKHNISIRFYLSEKKDDQYDQKLWAIGNYYSLIDLTDNILIILDNTSNPVGALPLIRCCIDTYINIKNIINDENYEKYKRHEKELLNQDLKKLYESHKQIKICTPEQEKIMHSCLDDIDLQKKSLKEIEAKYYYDTKKRKLANISDDIDEMYDTLSDHIHSRHLAIMQRHVRMFSPSEFQASKKIYLRKVLIYYPLIFLITILWESVGLIYFSFCKESNHHNLKDTYKAMVDCQNYIKKELKKLTGI